MLSEQKCKCGAIIAFIKVKKSGKYMPVDYSPVTVIDEEGNVITAHSPHWVNCPLAKQFRKK